MNAKSIARLIALFFKLSTLAVVTGCANIYEGTKAREDALRTPAERATSSPPMSYEQYQAERKKLGK